MDGFGAGLGDGGEDGFKGEIALGGGRGAEEDGFVSFKDVEGVAVGFRVNGDGSNAHAAQGAEDASGDGAAVGDEDFFEHKEISRRKGSLGEQIRGFWLARMTTGRVQGVDQAFQSRTWTGVGL